MRRRRGGARLARTSYGGGIDFAFRRRSPYRNGTRWCVCAAKADGVRAGGETIRRRGRGDGTAAACERFPR